MSLKEFQSGGGFHLRRDHTQQVVFNPDYVDSRDFSTVNYEFQGAGILTGQLPFPMEIDPDGHVMEDERRLGE